VRVQRSVGVVFVSTDCHPLGTSVIVGCYSHWFARPPVNYRSKSSSKGMLVILVVTVRFVLPLLLIIVLLLLHPLPLAGPLVRPLAPGLRLALGAWRGLGSRHGNEGGGLQEGLVLFGTSASGAVLGAFDLRPLDFAGAERVDY